MHGFGLQRAPRHLLFGWGQRRAVSPLAALTGRRILLCTDERVSGEPFFRDIVAELQARDLGVAVFDEVGLEVPVEAVEASTEKLSSFMPDVVVAIGGGSCLDFAKSLALLLRHGGRLADYYGEMLVPGPVVPIIALPTTSGTGSEVTPVAVVSDKARSVKVGISSPHLIPQIAICDPELTLTCPASLTAHAGADALTHAIEAYTARRREPDPELSARAVFVGKNALSDLHAAEAIRLISANLEQAVTHPENRAAREAMMMGALLAGLAFATAGTAAAHAIQYPLGALTRTPHGMGVAALMPFVLEFNRPAITRELAEIAGFFGIEANSEDESATATIKAVRQLIAAVGVPSRLSDLGFARADIGWAAERAMEAKRLISNNPRELDVKSIESLLEGAL